MRWSNLEIDAEDRAQLPGYREQAVVRHFEAPDSIPTRFYEVRAKSILNRVPEASRMPFRWTINPYRGCSHACAYCVSGDTLVLLSTGREKAIRELQVGERVYGTRLDGGDRRLVETEVLDTWSSVKPAFQVRLQNGQELVASEEHRFLTGEGWKRVAATAPGPPRCPQLTVGTRLLGVAGSSEPPVRDADHERLYPSADRGTVVMADDPLQICSIEPLGREMPMYDITTGTGDFIANGVVSHNCFARPTHTYLDFDAGRDFEREIVVKVNAPERLRVELARPSWKGEHIALGTNTDPYQWVEGRYKLMPGIWQAMIDARNPGSVLTKSPLLLRDLALMKELAARADFSAAVSVPTIDERAWRQTEPHTPNPRARLEAVAELTRAGIRTGVLVAPLMPGINDSPEQLAEILALAEEAGAAYVSGIALHLRGEVRKVFFDFLQRRRPDLVARYRELYRRGAYAPVPERRRLARLISGPDLDPSERGRGAFLAPRPGREGPETAAGSEPEAAEPLQGTLFDAIGT